VERTGEGRAVNRHDYQVSEIDVALDRPVVKRLLELLRLRVQHLDLDDAMSRGHQPLSPEPLAVGPLAIDTRRRMVRVGDRDVLLRTKEYALLEYLARRAGDVVSRADIAEHVWDEHYDPLSNVVDVYVQRLRRKLDEPGAESMIRTRRGEGYQLIAVGVHD
jgi:DNA-binding response OmpR family regulator